MIFPENFCLDVGRSTTRGHDTQAAAAALHVFLIKLHVLEGNRDLFFGVRRKTWRLGRFLSLSILHFAFFVGHGLFFTQIQHMWNLNIKPNKKIIMSFEVPWFVPIVKLLVLSKLFIYFRKNKKNIAKRHNSANVIPSRSWLKMAWCKTAIAWFVEQLNQRRQQGHPPKEKTHMETGKSVDFASFLEMSEDDTTCLMVVRVVIIYFLRSICSGIFVDTHIDSRRVPHSPFEWNILAWVSVASFKSAGFRQSHHHSFLPIQFKANRYG